MGNTGEVGLVEGASDTSTSPRPTVFGHEPFSGTYRTRVEPNGRIALPTPLKAAFVDAAMIRARRSDHLQLWTPRGFEATVDALGATDTGGMLDPQTRLRIFKSAPRISVDRQSRFVVPPELRERVGIEPEAEVVLAGAVESIEIWPAVRFDEQEAGRFDDVDLLFDTHSGLPTGPA